MKFLAQLTEHLSCILLAACESPALTVAQDSLSLNLA